MTYQRVIPRDLFNDGNLLKCYGALWIALEKLNIPAVSLVLDESDDCEFRIWQDESDGSTSIENVQLFVRGEAVRLFRPMNSRDAFPLMAQWGCEDVPVFHDDGELTAEFLARIT